MKRTERILVVDDESDILESVKMLLETSEYSVDTINDGKKVIERLKKEDFDLVLLDILMPNISGLNLLKQIRLDPEIKEQKIVFFSVVDPSTQGKKIIDELYPLDFIPKPTNNTFFKEKIKQILGTGA